MSAIIHQVKCPACASANIAHSLSAVDYTVSQSAFAIWHCNDCTLRFTQDIPDAAGIIPYYQSVEYISHSDTNKGIINRLYHLVRNYTLKTKYTLIKKVSGLNSGKLLDIGAGTGAFSNTMQSKGWEVTGLEPDSTARQQAMNNYQLQLFTPDTIQALTPAGFDVITLWHVLEHVHDLEGYWNHFQCLLNNKGQLIIAVPNYTSYDAAYYREYWAAYDVPRHLYHFSPESIERLARKHGFKLEATYPMWFDSFYVSMLSEKYRHKKNKLFSALIHGLISNIKTIGNSRNCSSVIYQFSKSV